MSNYTKGEVEHCVNQLRERKLVEVEYGSRANRFDQRLSRSLFLDKPAQAVLTIMLLRGPQTINELLNRTDRMVRFDNPQAVTELLNGLLQKTKPIFMHIPRQSGQREDRYMHLLCGKPDLSTWTSASTSSSVSNDTDLIARVDELERQLARVMQELGIEE